MILFDCDGKDMYFIWINRQNNQKLIKMVKDKSDKSPKSKFSDMFWRRIFSHFKL